jgi:outer membrane protein assembly factor BamB
LPIRRRRPDALSTTIAVLVAAALSCLLVLTLTRAPGVARPPAHRNAPGTATAVCGSLPPGETIWTAVGSPYQVCSTGLVVPSGATLTIDGSLGQVQVQVQGVAAGITATGLLHTQSTTAQNNVVMTGPSGWLGLTLVGPQDYNLNYLTIGSARQGINATSATHSVTVDHSSITTTEVGLVLDATTAVSVTNNLVTSSGNGIYVGMVPAATAPSVNIVGNTVQNPLGPAGGLGTGIGVSEIPNPTIRGNSVSGSGGAAIVVSDQGQTVPVSIGPGRGIDGNVGHGNGHDVIGIAGIVSNSFTWVGDPNPSSTDQPLGYAPYGLTIKGPYTATLPAGARVSLASTLTLAGASLDGRAGGAVFRKLDPSNFDTASLNFDADGAGNHGNGNLDSATFQGVQVALYSGASSTAGSARCGLVLTNSTATLNSPVFDTDSALCISGGSFNAQPADSAITLTNPLASSIVGATISSTRRAISVKSNGAAPVAIDRNSISASVPTSESFGAIEMLGQVIGTGPLKSAAGLTISNNTISGGTNGIRVTGFSNYPGFADVTVDHPGVQGNHVHGASGAAISLDGVVATIGPGANIDGDTGYANGLDGVLVGGEADGDLSWLTPSNAPTDHALGYAVGLKGLTMRGAHQLTLGSGAVMKVMPGSTGINLLGTTVDARAGSGFITSLADDSIGAAACSAVAPGYCRGTPAQWGTMALHADPSSPAVGNASFSGTTIAYGDLAFDSGATSSTANPSFGLTFAGGEIDSAPGDALTATSAVSLSNLTVQGSAGNGLVLNGTGNSLSGLQVRDNRGQGIHLGAPGSTITASTVTGNGYLASNAAQAYGVTSLGQFNATCLLVHDNAGGISAAAGSSVTQSNLFGNNARGDADLLAGGAGVIADHDWWGQAGGPIGGQSQGGADTSSALSAPASCAPAPDAQHTPTSPSPSSATSYQADSTHTGTQVGDNLTPPLSRDWVLPTGGTASFPLVAGGAAYTVADFPGGTGQKLFSLDLASGQRLWGPLDIGGAGSFAGAAYDAGTLFVVSEGGRTRAIDARSGQLKWSVQLPGTNEQFHSAPVARDGRLYIGSANYSGGNGSTRALSQADGHQLWLAYYGAGSATPAATATDIFVSRGCGAAADLDAASGSVKWSTPLTYNGCFDGLTPALAGGTLYVADSSGGRMLTASSGTQAGSFDCDGTPAIDANVLYCVRGGSLRAENASTGAQNWIFRGDGGVLGAPIVNGGFVYARSGSGAVYAVDKSTGLLSWRGQAMAGSPAGPAEGEVPARPLGGLATAGGALVVPSSQGLAVFGMFAPHPPGTAPVPPTPQAVPPTVTGDEARSVQIDPAHAGSQPNDSLAGPLTRHWDVDLGNTVSYPVIFAGKAFVTTTTRTGTPPNQLIGLDLATGSQLWPPLQLGSGAMAPPAYDNGHVFVTDGGGNMDAVDAATGLISWSVPLQTAGGTPVADGGRVYLSAAGCRDNTAFRETDGARLWTNPEGCGGPTEPPVVTASGIYMAEGQGWTRDLDPASGHVIWQTPPNGTYGSFSAFYNGRLYASDDLRGNVSFDGNTGAMQPAEFSSTMAPAFDAGRGFFISGTTLFAEDLATSTVLWSFQAPTSLVLPPIVVNGRVYTGSLDGKLFALAADSGAVGWNGDAGREITAASSRPFSGLSAAEGVLLVPAGNHLQAYFTAGAPGAPTAVVATPGDARATVTWQKPASDGGNALTSYTVVCHSVSGACPAPVVVSGTPPASQATVAGLTNGASYTFTVSAGNANGTGPPSQPSAPVTPVGVTPPPQPGPNPTVGWEAPDGSLQVRDGAGLHDLGGQIIAAPAIANLPRGDGSVAAVFIAVGADHDLWVRSLSAGWRRLDDHPVYCIDNPAAVVRSGSLTVACEGDDHALWRGTGMAPSDGSLPQLGSAAWSSLGGYLTAGPAAYLNRANNVAFLAVGTDSRVWYSTGAGFTQLAWSCIGHPAMARNGANLTFACTGLDHQGWYDTSSGGSWAGARPLGGYLNDGMGVLMDSSTTSFFAEGSDQQIWKRSLSQDWKPLGSYAQHGVTAAS